MRRRSRRRRIRIRREIRKERRKIREERRKGEGGWTEEGKGKLRKMEGQEKRRELK